MYGRNGNEYASPPVVPRRAVTSSGPQLLQRQHPLELIESLSNLHMSKSHPGEASTPPELTRPRSMQWVGGPKRSKVSLRAIMQDGPSGEHDEGKEDCEAPVVFAHIQRDEAETLGNSNHSCSPTTEEDSAGGCSLASQTSSNSLPEFTAQPPAAVTPLARGADREAFLELARGHLTRSRVDMVETALAVQNDHSLSGTPMDTGIAVGVEASDEFDTPVVALGRVVERKVEESTVRPNPPPPTNDLSSMYDLQGASEYLSEQEMREIEMALRASEQSSSPGASTAVVARQSNRPSRSFEPMDEASPAEAECRVVDASSMQETPSDLDSRVAAAMEEMGAAAMSAEERRSLEAVLRASLEETSGRPLTPPPTSATAAVTTAEATAIEKALRDADEEQERQSLQLALRMIAEEAGQTPRTGQQQGNVRTMTRQQLEEERAREAAVYERGGPVDDHADDQQGAGFRINSGRRQEYSRLDQNMIVGPNQEVRTKHDMRANGVSNAYRLGLDTQDQSSSANVSNSAYNSFQESMRRQDKNGGSSDHGGGKKSAKAGVSPAMAESSEPNVLKEINRAVNNGWITKCNGVVKQGDGSAIYHGTSGFQSEGFDVAIKVFQHREQQPVEGRLTRASSSRSLNGRQHLSQLAEKEYENLVRANLAGVPVPTPLMQKGNILFMRFLGGGGWPAPQLHELGVRKGSRKWSRLYSQTIESVRRLFRSALLVHGNLNEYNILAVPANNIDNWLDGDGNEVQVALIDFGQAVDARHPEAYGRLRRDLESIRIFFSKRGVATMSTEESFSLITGSGSFGSTVVVPGGHSINANDLPL